MNAISLICGDAILQQTINFVGQSLANPNWKVRYSSLIALGAVTEGPNRLTFINTITPGLQMLLNLFEDSSRKVREGIAWVFSKISEVHCEIFKNQQFFDQFIGIVLIRIQDAPRISNHICKTIENMSSYFSSRENPMVDNVFTSRL